MKTLVATIIVFGLLILVHELGHFFGCRITGVKVLELALGFGPRLLGWKRGDTSYSLRAIPLGGFCRMLGEDEEDEPTVNSFNRKSLSQRALILLGGPLMN